MKTPPFLLGAALLFWGWQSGLLIQGAAMGVILECARFSTTRWELSDDDFARIWTFSTLLFLAAAVYAFTTNQGPAAFGKMFGSHNFIATGAASNTAALTSITMLRWSPMVFFVLIAAQMFSTRPGIPLETISIILRRRWMKARQSGQPAPPSHVVNIAYPYLVTCLLAASGHAAQTSSFFWGLAVLLAWALWSQRPRRFGAAVCASALAAAVMLGYFAQRVIGDWHPIEKSDLLLFSFFHGHGADPKETLTDIGHIGRMKTSSKIIIRLEPKDGALAPGYLRVASYRLYASQMWSAGSSRSDFANVPETPPRSGTWPLLRGKASRATVNIACYLDGANAEDHNPQGLLPLPMDSVQLENLPAYVLQKNGAGAVLAEGPGLVMFDAHYGAGATIDSPPGFNSPPGANEDLTVPEEEKPALAQVVSQLNVAGQSDERKLLAVAKFFGSPFKYTLFQDAPKPAGTNETPLAIFLLDTHSGHCEYFATATVLLLRSLGIPARYAVGFAVHEAAGRGYVVRQRNAHAWCMAWSKKEGAWQIFDTTPGGWVSAEDADASHFEFLSDLWSWTAFQIAKLRWSQTHLKQYILVPLAPVLAYSFYRILFRGNRRRQSRKLDKPPEPSPWPGLDSEFYRLEQQLFQRGSFRHPGETLSAWLRRVAAEPGLAALERPFEQLLLLHYRYRFDPRGLTQAEREDLRGQVETCVAAMARPK
jgi:protein-glutamine gamma-glutamyltransferase